VAEVAQKLVAEYALSDSPMLSDEMTAAEAMGQGAQFVAWRTAQINDTDALLKSTMGSLRSELKLVTVDGYDSAARKYSCEATMAVSTGGQTREARLVYEVQTVQGERGQFVVKMKKAPVQAATYFREYALTQYRKRKFGTQWSGEYACGGVNGDTSETRGPFSMKVTATVDADWHMVLERTTLAAGRERIEGTLGDDGSVMLRGVGSNGADDRWHSDFAGRVERGVLSAKGKIVAQDASEPVVRECQITLRRADAANASSRQPTALTASAVAVKAER
jgi:hypothetical protein